MNLIKQLWRLVKLQRQFGGVKGAMHLIQSGPKYVMLYQRLLTDPRVPAWSKAMLLGALGFAVSPLNMPNYIPVVGALDDIGIILFAGNLFMKNVPAHVLAEHRLAVGITDMFDQAA